MTITELIKQSHGLAKEKGWYSSGRSIPELLCLIHSEISEALEEYRLGMAWSGIYTEDGTESGKPMGFDIEIADAVIRIADMCGYLGIDLEQAIATKHEYNKGRPHRHGNKKA
jgi:hypothetical protein